MIYFAFTGDVEELRKVSATVGPIEFIEYNGVQFGFVHSNHHNVRWCLDNMVPGLKALPGPSRGKLLPHHAEHIRTAFPNAKSDDSMVDVLQSIYDATGHEGFNPNHH